MEVVLSNADRRARMHAALGEPVRLAIVDHLTLADASPGELSARFGLPTNLLAHHLNVLTDAGLIRRVRSEGDRRRQYVQLQLDDPTVAALTAMSGGTERLGTPARLVFVCTANSARSQLAASAWRRVSTLPAISAGTRPADRVHPVAIAVAERHGLDISGAVPTALADIALQDDLVVAVCDNAHEELAKTEPAYAGARRHRVRSDTAHRIRRPDLHWHVPDPVRSATPQAFEAAYTEITTRITRLASAVPGPQPVDDPDGLPTAS